MIIKSILFSKGNISGQPSLSDILNNHQRQTLDKIARITSLAEMNEAFLASLVKESLVEPLSLHLDRMTRQIRTEQFDGSQFPFDFTVHEGKRYPKEVARISIPFSGDPLLLNYTPDQYSFNFPQGEIRDRTIQFDIILWGYTDDDIRVKQQLDENIRLLTKYTETVVEQVKRFNESLPGTVKSAFGSKLEKLTKQHSIFDNLGIKEEKPTSEVASVGIPKTQKESTRTVQIIQYIENLYVQQLNQNNSNQGDVNNAIQSDK